MKTSRTAKQRRAVRTEDVIQGLRAMGVKTNLNWKNWDLDRQTKWVFDNFDCTKKTARNAAILY